MNDAAAAIAATGFFGSIIVIARSIAAVWSKRLEVKRGQALPDGVDERLSRIENAVDVIALEVERIAEGQRFALRLAEEREAAGRIAPRSQSTGRVDTPH